MKKALWLPLVVALAGSMTITGCASVTRATEVAAGVSGVRDVQNNIVVD